MRRLILLMAICTVSCGKDSSTGPTPRTPQTVSWTFCDPSHTPIWFAFQDGNGPWTSVPPSGATYTFNLNQLTGGVAWVTDQIGNGPWTEMHYAAAMELAASGTNWCVAHPDTSKVLVVSGAAIAQGEFAGVSIGAASQLLLFANFPVGISGVATGAQDLTAVKSDVTRRPVKGILRRGLDLPNNSTVPVLDFSANEAFDVVPAAVTIGNRNGEATALDLHYMTSDGTNQIGRVGLGVRAGPDSIFGFPSSVRRAGDLHVLQVSALHDGDAMRSVTTAFATVADQALTLGPPPTFPTLSTDATAPYLRLRASGPVQTEYASIISVEWQQVFTLAGSPIATISATKAYLGSAASYNLAIPDLSAASGWQNAWALRAGVLTFWYLNVTSTRRAVGDGYIEMSAAAAGSVTP